MFKVIAKYLNDEYTSVEYKHTNESGKWCTPTGLRLNHVKISSILFSVSY